MNPSSLEHGTPTLTGRFEQKKKDKGIDKLWNIIENENSVS